MTVPAAQAASTRRSARRRTVDGDRTDRRQAILLAAERLFAERGYAAVSIRQIADAAGVPPALVDYHFGQKHELFIAIFHHWRGTIDQRLQRLREARAAATGDALRRVVEAFVMPVLALRCSAEGEFYAQLVARELVYRTPQAERVLAELFDPLAHAFIDALHGIAPQAGRAHAAWAYQFALGALLHHISDHRVERLSRGANRAADPAAAALLVDFIRAGIAAVLPAPRTPAPVTPAATRGRRTRPPR
ncbi:MAG: TetR family transcriptional regulator [Rubrivivax sp.]|nr:TetR family transcriptional regulator [Rubrivivax sp.]